jgi:hypothetical protein
MSEQAAQEASPSESCGMMSKPPSVQRKRKRSLSAGSNATTIQLSGAASGQSLENSEPAKQPKPALSFGDKSASPRLSTPEPAPSQRHDSRTRQIEESDGESNANILVSGEGGGGHDDSRNPAADRELSVPSTRQSRNCRRRSAERSLIDSVKVDGDDQGTTSTRTKPGIPANRKWKWLQLFGSQGLPLRALESHQMLESEIQ